MLSKHTVSILRSLHLKKYSQEHNLFLAEGEKLVEEAIKSSPKTIKIICTEAWFDNNKNILIPPNISVEYATAKQISQVSTLVTPQEVLAVCQTDFTSASLRESVNKTVLYFHDLKDPGNAGTILRIADWFGYKDVFVSEESVYKYNPKLVQSSMGSVFRIGYHPIHTQELMQLKGHTEIIATTMSGDSVYGSKKIEKGIIMFGSESHGLPAELIGLANKRLTIPKHKTGNAESLNLAVATGIILSYLG